MNPETCPKCATSLQGDPIPAVHLAHKPDHDEQVARYGRCYCLPYGDDRPHFSRLVGIEVPGVYDGVLFWMCPDCCHAWPRFVDGRLARESAKYADAHNATPALSP